MKNGAHSIQDLCAFLHNISFHRSSPHLNSILLQLWGTIMQPALTSCTFALLKQSGGENDVRGKKDISEQGKRKLSEQFRRKAARRKNELCE